MKNTRCILAAIIMVLFLSACASTTPEKTSTEPKSTDTPAYTESEGTDTPAYTEPEPEYENDYVQDTATMGERNALKKAQDYLDFTAFSYTGLIDQLEFEGYTYQEALYGVDNCGADWNEQAAKKAAQYLEFMAFSRQGLIEQLEYEGFTHEQAVYGVTQNGY